MRNINKLSPKIYLFLTIIVSLTAMIIYRATIFRCLFSLTYNESKVTLWVIWGACLVVTYLMTRTRRRNNFSVFTNAVLPFGIYTVMAYKSSQSIIFSALEMAIIILCGLYGIAMLILSKFPDGIDKLLKFLKIKMFHFLNGTKSIVAVCLSVLVAYISCLYAFDSPSFVPAVKPAAEVEENKAEVIEKNMPLISKIDKSVWKNLTFEERLDTMQTLANVEKAQLGISHEVNVRSDSLGLGTYGTYDFKKHEVIINTQILMDDDSTEAVNTLCHELRHAYQHDSVDAFLSLNEEYRQLALFDDMRDFYENFEHYQSVARDGFDEYESQTVEADSRKYSEERTAFYFWAVDKYFVNANNGEDAIDN